MRSAVQSFAGYTGRLCSVLKFSVSNRTPLLFPDEMVAHISAQLSPDALFNYELFSFTPDVTVAFTVWWGGIREKMFGKPLSDMLGLFSFILTKIVGSASVQSVGAKRRLSQDRIFCFRVVVESSS